MKRIFQLCFSLFFFALGFSQGLKPVAQKVKNAQMAKTSFVKYDLFKEDLSVQKKAVYAAAAEDVSVMQLKKSEIARIAAERPDALEMTFPFEGKNITVELVKNEIFATGFRVNSDKGYVNYSPGVYYQGIVKGDNESLVAFSFFNNDVVGVSSIKNIGNIVVGKATNSEDYVSYNDQKLKALNPFVCGVEDVIDNQGQKISFDPNEISTAKLTDNCVRVYYEVASNTYNVALGNTTQGKINWVTAMHNNVSTLYQNDGIRLALSEIYVWTTTDPYTGDPGTILGLFRSTRTTYNGDIAQLLKYPSTTSIAYLNTLCGASAYSYCGVDRNNISVPTYSWNIEAMTHEMGHNLGSPHTHACAWNGDNTAIDGCGPASGNNEGCNAPLPTNGGTIMSYCHLVGSVGINFANGFGPQPGALIRNRINTSGCLGTDCIASCPQTITGVTVSNITNNSATATVNDATGTSWRYTLTKVDGTVVETNVVTNKVINLSNLQPGSFYFLNVGATCTGPEAYASRQLIYTNADWCSGVLATDSGGENANYTDGESWTKTFYPTNSTDKLKITFTQFDTESGSDYMIIYNGPNIASPRFGTTWSGTTIPGPFQSTHATGAITIRFISNATVNRPGWKANFECITLGTGENALASGINIAQTSAKGVFIIVSKDKVLSYKVTDASGKLVKTSSKTDAAPEKLDISNYPAGTYLVTISTQNETVTKKIIK